MKLPYQIEPVRLDREVANAAGEPAELEKVTERAQRMVQDEGRQRMKIEARQRRSSSSQSATPLQVSTSLPCASSSSPRASPVELYVVKPHQNGPESLRSILRKTTRERLFVHPKAWTDMHLAIFRVKDFHLEASLGLVLNREIHEYPSDPKLYGVLFGEDGIHDPMKNFARQIKTASKGVRVPMDLPVTWICIRYLEKIRTQIRRYPSQVDIDPLSLGHKAHVTLQYNRGRFLRTTTFDLEHMEFDLPAASQRFWTRGNSLQHHMWPIFAIHRKVHPAYTARRLRRSQASSCHRDWRAESRDPELVALLMAMAQNQWKKLKYGFHQGLRNRCCSDCVCPLVLWVVDTKLYWVRGHVPISHFLALDDPDFPMINDMELDMSYALDMSDEADHSKILMSLTAAFDDYFENVVEDLSLRRAPASMVRHPKESNLDMQASKDSRTGMRSEESLDKLTASKETAEGMKSFQGYISQHLKDTSAPKQRHEGKNSQAGLA
ncbi:hypothetical protein KEM54_006733 [Ascosphaera aggregata]|nr:hypothetical protein KEM54_006733 [Ascosphaera aggregata]